MSSFLSSTIEPSGLMVRAAMSLILISLPKDLAVEQIDLALRLPATLGEYFDPDVVVEDEVAFGIVVNPDLPEEGFGVRFFLDSGVFQ